MIVLINAYSMTDEYLVLTWCKSNSHLYWIDCWHFSATTLEIFLEFGQKNTKTETKKDDLEVSEAIVINPPVHDSVPDHVAHEASQHRHPAPEPSIRSNCSTHSCRELALSFRFWNVSKNFIFPFWELHCTCGKAFTLHWGSSFLLPPSIFIQRGGTFDKDRFLTH